MIKINKQVAKNKITCFLERNQVILFFHCNNSVSLNKDYRLLDLNLAQLAYHARGKGVTTLNGSSFTDLVTTDKNAKYYSETFYKQVFNNLNAFKSIMVKNRLAKKVFLEVNVYKSVYPQNEEVKPRRRLEYLEECLNLKERDRLITSLFQGPTLLLGCSDVKILEKGIDACAKNKELVLLGAFYESSIINNLQVKRLITFSNNSQGYVNLLFSMRDPFLRPFSLIRTLLKMRCLSVQQNRLICLLKVRKQEILVAAL